MRNSPEGLVFALSFCLPGLGQAYQKRWSVALLFFALFALSIERRVSVWVLPVLAIGAAFEAWWQQEKRVPIESPRPLDPAAIWRYRAFLGVAAVGGAAWLFLGLGHWLPFRATMGLSPRVTELATWVRNCRHALGKVPQTLEECPPGPAPVSRTDPWERPYRYRREGEGFELSSDGPNGISGDSDDMTYRFH